MLRAVAFDFNGVLVDDEPLHLALFQEILGPEGVELTPEAYYDRYLGLDDRECIHEVLTAASRAPSAEKVARLVDRKADLYQGWIEANGFPWYPGARELLAEVAGELPTVIVSGALRAEVEGALAAAGLAASIVAVVAAEDVKASKPDPEGYRLACERLRNEVPGLAPREVLAIEDSPAGLAAAAGAGLVTLGLAQTYPRAHLGSADLVADGVADLSLARLRELMAGG